MTIQNKIYQQRIGEQTRQLRPGYTPIDGYRPGFRIPFLTPEEKQKWLDSPDFTKTTFNDVRDDASVVRLIVKLFALQSLAP